LEFLEIGKDFCFMGQEYRVQVGQKDLRMYGGV
jgi:predicted nuclease of restriction endonuclease-like (RecB) superfamily